MITNLYIKGAILDEADEQPSNEYARADDDDIGQEAEGAGCGTREMVNPSDEEEFTYSYGDVLSAAATAAGVATSHAATGTTGAASKSVEEVKLETSESIIPRPAPPQINTVLTPNTLTTPVDLDMTSSVGKEATMAIGNPPMLVKLTYDLLKLNIHRLPGKIF